ncbi:MAG: hypothetical protein LUG95_02750, partial [Clostridiales bacterium]|nr:hypothetical protein [Clostridiales bacterium]
MGEIDSKSAMQELALFCVPLLGATVVQSISNFADTASIQYALTLCSEDELLVHYPQGGEDVYTYVYGIYSSALDFKNLVPSVIMALGVTAVPAVSTAHESSNECFSLLMTSSIMKYTSILSCAGGVFVALFCEDMLNIFYSTDNSD